MQNRATGAAATAPRLPGPQGDRIEDVKRDIAGFLESCAREYGAACAFELAGRPWVFLADPLLTHEALTAPFDALVAGPSLAPGEATMGSSIMMDFTPSWRHRRSLIQRPLSHSAIAGFADPIVRRATETADAWSASSAVEVHAHMQRLTLLIVAEALFSWDVGPVVERILALSGAFHADFMDAWLGARTEPDAGYLAAVAEHDAVVHAIIGRRRAAEDAGDDLLGMLIRSQDEHGRPLSDDVIRDEANTLIFAGHSTTALTLTFALVLLANHRTVQDRVAAELAAAAGSRALSFGHLERVPLLRAVVEETLRLYPVNYFIDRTAASDVRIGDVEIAAGTRVLMSPWVMHRDERLFSAAGGFDPDRFLPGRRKEIPKHAYIPFGGGPKVCVGSHFAMLEASLVLGTILQRWSLTPADPYPPRVAATSLLDPEGGARVRVEPRATN